MNRFIVFTLSLIFLSCAEKTPVRIYDVSDLGSINSIREFEGKIYALNSSNSTILLIEKDSITVHRNINIEGRDFLQDFFIYGCNIFYSNTYDEIFTASWTAIEDTLKVENPGRIAVFGNSIFVTSRIREGEFFYLRSFDLSDHSKTAEVSLNSGRTEDPAFSKVYMTVSDGILWLYNPFRSRIERYDNDLNITASIELDQIYSYGAFTLTGSLIKILAEKDADIFFCIIEIEQNTTVFEKADIPSGSYDINSSCVTEKEIYLYDFIKGKLMVIRII